MPQDYGETVDQTLTPVEFLAKSWEKEELTRVKTYLGSMKYTPQEQEHAIGELSGGQRAKLFFLKMILDGANVLVLDEPTRNFSPLSGPVIRGVLAIFQGASSAFPTTGNTWGKCAPPCTGWNLRAW